MIAAAFALALGLSAPISPPAAPLDPWVLVWSDEFDADHLDPSKWSVQDAAIANNQELQYYTPDAVSVHDGVLVITAAKRPLNGRQYTSGLIDSRGLFSMAFGKFECRAKLPRGQGMWPAIWMLPEDDRWPPEIDIMENLGQEPRRIHTTHHWGPAWPNNRKTTAHFDGPDYSQDFHVFGVEWSPERLDWYIDGDLKFSSTQNIPQDPFYFIINLAVGGNWGGNPDDKTTFPQDLRIDWVRAYQRVDTSNATLLVDSHHGEALPDPLRWSFKPGEKVSLRADPDIGYVFKEWSGDADGTRNPLELEVSRNLHVIAEFVPAPDAPALLSRGRPVRASSSEGSGMEPERAVDDSLWTRWSARHAAPLWLEVDLGAVHQIDAARLVWTQVLQGSYTLEVSDDSTTWRPAAPARRGAQRREKLTGLKARGRYIRVSIHNLDEGAGCSLFSFDVYGK